MAGWVYLIRNKDLYKIGITENLEHRMKQLKPDEIISTLEAEDYESLEKELHKRYKKVRIPQTEYFRLTKSQLADCSKRLSGNYKAINSHHRNRLVNIGTLTLVSLVSIILWRLTSLSSEQIEMARDSIIAGFILLGVGITILEEALNSNFLLGILLGYLGIILIISGFFAGLDGFLHFLPNDIMQEFLNWLEPF